MSLLPQLRPVYAGQKKPLHLLTSGIRLLCDRVQSAFTSRSTDSAVVMGICIDVNMTPGWTFQRQTHTGNVKGPYF